MATFKSDINALSDMVSNLNLKADDIEDILNEGGKIITDEIRKGIDTIPVRDNKRYSESNKGTGLLKSQKDDLRNNLGVAKMKVNNGIYDVKIGFYNGYTKTKTKKWIQGVPIQMLVRSLEKGTSWLNKFPFVSKAFKKSQNDVIKAMQNELNKKVK